MLCERCGAREATIHAMLVLDDAPNRAVHLCQPCVETPRPVDLDEARFVLALEASGRPAPPGFFALAAADFRRRSDFYQQPLPPDVAAFAARYGAPAADYRD